MTHSKCHKDIFVINACVINQEIIFDIIQEYNNCECKLEQEDYEAIGYYVHEFFYPGIYNA